MSIVHAAPALSADLSPPAEQSRLRRTAVAVATVCAAFAVLMVVRQASAPALTIDPTFTAGTGVGQYVGEDVLGAAPGSTVGFQATEVTATVKAVIRNDGRFSTVVRGNANPPNIIVSFLPSGAAGQDGTSTVRLAPGAQATAVVTATGMLCSADDRGTVVPYFGLRATTFGVHDDTSTSSQIVFDAATLPPTLCSTPPTT